VLPPILLNGTSGGFSLSEFSKISGRPIRYSTEAAAGSVDQRHSTYAQTLASDGTVLWYLAVYPLLSYPNSSRQLIPKHKVQFEQSGSKRLSIGRCKTW